MQTAGLGVDQRGQRIDIRALQLSQLALLNNKLDNRVLVFQALQHIDGRAE